MAHELRGQRFHRRFFLRAAVVAPVVWLATGCDELLETCSECGGKGRVYDECRNCGGRGALGDKKCPSCTGSGKTSFACRACKSDGKRPGNAGTLASVFHALNVVGILLFSGLGVFLLCKRRVSVSRSRQLSRPMGIVLGVFSLLTAAAVAAIELLWFAIDFIGGTGIEGRTGGETVGQAIVRLKFGAAGMIVAGAFLLVGGLCALLGGSRAKDPRWKRCRLVTNRTDRPMLLLIEPGGRDCWLLSGEKAELRAEVEFPTDDFLLADNPDGVTARPSQGMGKISVWQDGREVECGHQRPAGWTRRGRAEPLS